MKEMTLRGREIEFSGDDGEVRPLGKGELDEEPPGLARVWSRVLHPTASILHLLND